MKGMTKEKNRRLTGLWLGMLLIIVLAACSNDDDFVTSSVHHVAFSSDTLRFDTIFANVPTATKSVWVYNGLARTSVLRKCVSTCCPVRLPRQR